MPRGPRLDAPGVLHHVMARGIDRQAIFRDRADGAHLLELLAELVRERMLMIYAWALMPNHFHLLVRTRQRPLARCMRSLLTSYAGAFNRRHDRVGHLFQNRYKSVVCEADAYFVELVRYIHLNPLRAGVVAHVDDLDDYPYTGHSAILATVPRDWQSTDEVLERFGRNVGWARAAYRRFVVEGALMGVRRDLDGGGLVRTVGGWEVVRALRRGRESFTSDERVLGGSRFVERILREISNQRDVRATAAVDLATIKAKVCASCGVNPQAVSESGRVRVVTKAREGIAFLWVDYLGCSGRSLAFDLGLKPATIYKAAKRGRIERERWINLLAGAASDRGSAKEEQFQ